MVVFSSSPLQHQVFINYYDKDDELNRFVIDLVHALKYNTSNISADMDGNRSLEVQLEEIKESRIALVIFSGKYTESISCLTELRKINERRKEGKLVAIPIFFKMDKSTVDELRGQFGDAFWNQDVNDGTKFKWKKALQSISKEPGHMLDRKRPKKGLSYTKEEFQRLESKFIETIVEHISKLLVHIHEIATENFLDMTKKPQKALQESHRKRTFGIQETLNICQLLIILFCLQQIADMRKILQSEKVEDRKIINRSEKDEDRQIINSTLTNSSLHGKVKLGPPNIQVFINFYKDEVGKTFISHLVYELERSEVNITKQKIGEDHSNRFKRIEGSGIAIVVFSSRYPESDYCLDELVKIKKLAEKGRLKVFPIFYNVPISNVKGLKGTFGDHFTDKEIMYKSDKAKIKQWKKAIQFVPHKHALEFDEKRCNTGGESYFVRKVVKKVLEVLEDICLAEKKPIFWWFNLQS